MTTVPCTLCDAIYQEGDEHLCPARLKNRKGDQPLPTAPKEESTSMQDMVIADIEDRKALGIQRYGTLLHPHNGRDMLQDAYEEALDLCVYLRGCIAERDASEAPRTFDGVS